MNGWVDIHCHVLPGVDDSAVDMETSLDMLRSAVAEGLEQLVVTPHYQANDGPEKLRLHERTFSGLRRGCSGPSH